MAIIFRRKYNKNIPLMEEPYIYVDTINTEGFIAEMYNITIRYIRESIDELGNSLIVKREHHCAKNEKDIYYNKKDGLWFISDEKNRTITLYEKKTIYGRLYNSIYINKLFELSCKQCSKIVPQIIKKSSKFDNFKNELTERVIQYKNRSDALN